METPKKNWESLISCIKEIKRLKGPQKYNSEKEIAYIKIIDTWIESDFDIDQTYQVVIDYLEKYHR